jgi:hypothetical protein
MDEFSTWMPLVVSLVGSGGLVWINIYTVRSNNKRDVARDKSQHRHDELMIAAEQTNASRVRLSEQKHAAFGDLLAQVTKTTERYHSFSEARISGSFDSSALQLAASQAMLLCSVDGRNGIGTIVDDFRRSYFGSSVEAEAKLVDVLADELN